MTPEIPKGPEINGGVDNLPDTLFSGIVKVVKNSRTAITNLTLLMPLTLGGLQACSQQATADEGKPAEVQVAMNTADTGKLQPKNVSFTVEDSETLSPNQIFSEIEGIVNKTMTGDEQEEWLFYVGEFRNDSTVGLDREDFEKFALADNGEILKILMGLPREKFPENYILIDNAHAKLSLQVAKIRLSTVEGVAGKIN